MVQRSVTLLNQLGLHARASAKFVSTAGRFQSSLKVSYLEKTVNGKSIMAIMLLAASKGAELFLEIDGPDAAEMEDSLVCLINNRFGEAE